MSVKTLKTVDRPPTSYAPRRTVFSMLGSRFGLFLIASGVTGLLVYYLAWEAPWLVPVPPGVKVPYPEATRFLEKVAIWCGEHRVSTALLGAMLVLPGLLSRWSGPRYHLWCAILVSCALGFSYLSISAPLDRLVQQVKSNLPDARRVPDYLPGNVRE
jgi:hypothetical protein